jgi:hypothetical protein
MSLEEMVDPLSRPVISAPFAVHKPDAVIVVRWQTSIIEGVFPRPQPDLIVRSLSHVEDHQAVGVELRRIPEGRSSLQSRNQRGCAPLSAEAIEIRPSGLDRIVIEVDRSLGIEGIAAIQARRSRGRRQVPIPPQGDVLANDLCRCSAVAIRGTVPHAPRSVRTPLWHQVMSLGATRFARTSVPMRPRCR